MTNELRAVDIHIVDDDADVRDGLAWLFDSRGYAAVTSVPHPSSPGCCSSGSSSSCSIRTSCPVPTW